MRRLAVILALEVAVAGVWALSPLVPSCTPRGSGDSAPAGRPVAAGEPRVASER